MTEEDLQFLLDFMLLTIDNSLGNNFVWQYSKWFFNKLVLLGNSDLIVSRLVSTKLPNVFLNS